MLMPAAVRARPAVNPGAQLPLHGAAPCCRRRLEEAAPTLLLSGAKQLLELARKETSAAAESYVMLAAVVLGHGAGAPFACRSLVAAV